MRYRRAVVVACLLLLSGAVLEAQELNCEVTVNADNVTSGQRDYLRSFGADVKKYLRGQNRLLDDDLFSLRHIG